MKTTYDYDLLLVLGSIRYSINCSCCTHFYYWFLTLINGVNFM